MYERTDPRTVTFAGSDIRVYIISPHERPLATVEAAKLPPPLLPLDNIQTLTYSTYRETSPVRAIGHVGEKGRARGTRTVAGSMVFAVADRNPFLDIMTLLSGEVVRDAVSPAGLGGLQYSTPDQLPPLDVIVFFSNESGASAELALFGIQFTAEGQVMSINDLYTESTFQFTGQHMSLMRPGGFRSLINRNQNQTQGFQSIVNGNYSNNVRALVERGQNRFR